MDLKRIILAFTALAVLGAIAAASAGANNVTPSMSTWSVGGTVLASGATKNVKCGVLEETGIGDRLVLDGEVGEPPSTVAVKLAAKGIECINHEGAEGANGTSVIEQSGTTARAIGRLKFTGVTVVEPSGCEVKGGSVTTNPLEAKLLLDSASEEVVFTRFTATGTNLAKVEIIGASCPVAGTRIAKGAVCGQAENKTGVEAVTQVLTFGTSVETTAGNTGDSCELIFASNPAHLTGKVANTLTTGEKWGAKK
jgi:hypothetical protein